MGGGYYIFNKNKCKILKFGHIRNSKYISLIFFSLIITSTLSKLILLTVVLMFILLFNKGKSLL